MLHCMAKQDGLQIAFYKMTDFNNSTWQTFECRNLILMDYNWSEDCQTNKLNSMPIFGNI